jgi:hypothetical protein
MASLALAACTPGQPALPTPEPFTALYLVTNGPYPLYATDGEWLAARAPGMPATQAEQITIEAERIARARNHFDPRDGAWLLRGCLFDVQGTGPDPREASYLWAHGRIVRCDEAVMDGVLEPQMGVRPNKLHVYDGRVGYFPMSLLDRYTSSAPATRR